MKIWEIPVTWEMRGTLKVEAKTLEEAMKIARDNRLIPLPGGYYVNGSWRLTNIDEDFIRECYNNNQKDEEEN